MATTIGLGWNHVSSAAPPNHYVRIEIKGQLERGHAAANRQRSNPLLHANDMEFELDFGKTSPSPQELNKLYGKTVVAKGTLEKRKGTGGQERLVCVVENKLTMADTPTSPEAKKHEFLIGYKQGKQDEAKELLEGLGLEVIEHYKPGQFLRAQTGEKTEKDFGKKIKSSDAIRYMESNATVGIPRGEDLPTESVTP